MPRWTIDSPTTLDFDGIVALRVRIVAGSVAVLATADRPRLEVTEVSGQPLLVTHEAGILTVSYEDLNWDGLLGWLQAAAACGEHHGHGAEGLPDAARRGERHRDRVRGVRADIAQERVRRHDAGRRDRRGGRQHGLGQRRGPGTGRERRVQIGVRRPDPGRRPASGGWTPGPSAAGSPRTSALGAGGRDAGKHAVRRRSASGCLRKPAPRPTCALRRARCTATSTAWPLAAAAKMRRHAGRRIGQALGRQHVRRCHHPAEHRDKRHRANRCSMYRANRCTNLHGEPVQTSRTGRPVRRTGAERPAQTTGTEGAAATRRTHQHRRNSRHGNGRPDEEGDAR